MDFMAWFFRAPAMFFSLPSSILDSTHGAQHYGDQANSLLYWYSSIFHGAHSRIVFYANDSQIGVSELIVCRLPFNCLTD